MRTLSFWSLTASPNAALALVLVLNGMLVFVGEVGIFYLCSWRWQWPEVVSVDSLSQLVRHIPPELSKEQFPISATERYHYQSGDMHYYTRPPYVKHGAPKDYVATKALRVLILSDPHIMCTYDK